MRWRSHDDEGVPGGARATGSDAAVRRHVHDNVAVNEDLEVMTMSVPAGWKARSRPRRFDEEFFTFEIEGSWIQGRLVGTKSINGQDRFIFDVEDHDPRITTLPSHTSHILLPAHKMLVELLEGVAFGQSLIIEYEGEQEIPGRAMPMKTYNVYEPDPAASRGAAKSPSRPAARGRGRKAVDPGPEEPPIDEETAEEDDAVAF
jgi:hypothetical protein